MVRFGLKPLSFAAILLTPHLALAVSSAEIYTPQAYGYGRVEARVRFAAGDGIVSSFFLWKNGSDKTGAYWNELDFEKVGADCHLETNPIFGMPAVLHSQKHMLAADLCGSYHVYAFEWTPDAISWLVDGMSIRKETGDTAQAFASNAASTGMEIHFNVWPGNAMFGGNFSPSILPVHEYLDWVQFSSYKDGAFKVEWRDDNNGQSLSSRWQVGQWNSPKDLSTHDARNVNLLNGYVVLSVTADDKTGPAGANPEAIPSSGGKGGTSSGGGTSGGGAGGTSGAGGAGAGRGGTGGMPGSGGSPSVAGSAGSMPATAGTPSASGGSGGSPGTITSGTGGSLAITPPSNPPSNGGCSLGSTQKRSSLASAFGLAFALLLSRRRRGTARQ